MTTTEIPMTTAVHKSLLVFLIDDSVKAIRAVYEKVNEPTAIAPMPMAYGQDDPHSSPKLRGYLFKTHSADHKVGDLLVVPTDTRHGFTVVKVVEIDAEPDMDAQHAIKWVVGKVDTATYFDIVEQELSIIDTVAKAELKTKRDNLRKTLLGEHEDQFADMKLAIGKGEVK
jgi:hypothetical protein|tara:strand:+ start:4542 stop:5054 length:513 start_codon:yes stop_codon:yes gene_type:complete